MITHNYREVCFIMMLHLLSAIGTHTSISSERNFLTCTNETQVAMIHTHSSIPSNCKRSLIVLHLKIQLWKGPKDSGGHLTVKSPRLPCKEGYVWDQEPPPCSPWMWETWIFSHPVGPSITKKGPDPNTPGTNKQPGCPVFENWKLVSV